MTLRLHKTGIEFPDGSWQTTASGGSGGGGIPEAPIDGKQYARQDEAWTEVTGGENHWTQSGNDLFYTNNNNGFYINTAGSNSVNIMNYNGSSFGDIWLRGYSSPDRGVGCLSDGRVMIPDVAGTSTAETPNLFIASDGQIVKSTSAMYSAEEVDKKLAVKDKLIEKLSARLDALEAKLKKVK